MAGPRYEIRECGRCFEGRVYESSVPTGRWITCDLCRGVGKRRVYVYAKKGRCPDGGATLSLGASGRHAWGAHDGDSQEAVEAFISSLAGDWGEIPLEDAR